MSDDDRGFTYEQWRARWQADAMKWSSEQKPPKGWDPAAQLAKITGH